MSTPHSNVQTLWLTRPTTQEGRILIMTTNHLDNLFFETLYDAIILTLTRLFNPVTQEGRILIMTTNHLDKLDPALTRPGRADVHLRLGLASRAQVTTMYRRFYPDAPEDDVNVSQQVSICFIFLSSSVQVLELADSEESPPCTAASTRTHRKMTST